MSRSIYGAYEFVLHHLLFVQVSCLHVFLVFLFFLFLLPTESTFFPPSLPDVLRTPERHFGRLAAVGYPWQPQYLFMKHKGYPTMRMHYIDEGPYNATETVLLLHGTPAWSYLFRKVIPPLLATGYRVVAPDFLGCGRSDKLTDPARYSHALHVFSLLTIVEALDLKDVTLVGHDLGGPIGGSVLKRRPFRFKRLVLLNTWVPQGDVFSSLHRTVEHLPYLSFRVTTLLLGLNHPVGTIFTFATAAHSADVSDGYLAPFPDNRYKAGVSAWPLMIPLYPEEELAREMRTVAEFLKYEWRGPSLLAYSDRELFTIPGAALLEEVLPYLCRVTVPGAGHFLQEDRGELVGEIIGEFVRGNCLMPVK